jgi:hypothetical protein
MIATHINVETTTLKLRSGRGYVYRTISTAPPRECTQVEIPLIDLAGLNGSELDRKKIAQEVRTAAEDSGFFYISNHGVEKELIERAHNQAKRHVSYHWLSN